MPVHLISSSLRDKNRAKRVGIFLILILALSLLRFRWTDGLSFPNLFKAYTPNEHQWVKNNSSATTDDSMISSLSNIQRAVDNLTTSNALPIRNVLLMGQFNYNPESAQSIQDWVSVWCNYFSHIVVTGPFSLDIGNELDAMGIAYRRGRTDSGWVSPYENLANVAQEVAVLANTSDHDKSSSMSMFEGIDAVLYIHDDSLLNMTYFLDRNSGVFPTDRVLWTDYYNDDWEDLFSYYVQLVQETWENGTVRMFPRNYNHTEGEYFHNLEWVEREQRRVNLTAPREFPWTTAAEESHRPFRVRYSEKLITSAFRDDDPSINDGGMASTPALFERITLAGRYWAWYGWCMKHHLIMLVEGPREVLDEYAISVEERSIEHNIDGTIVRSVQVSRQFKFLLNRPADFFLLPMEWTEEFSRLAEVFAQYHTFLEAALATIVPWILSRQRKKENAREGVDHEFLKVQSVSLCTHWAPIIRGTAEMVDACLEQSAEGMGLYHPVKLGKIGIEEYQRWQTTVQLPLSDEVRSVFKTGNRTRN